jgi:guanylate kinase
MLAPQPNGSQKVIILTAPSGAGKSSIAKYLLTNYPSLSFSVSATTRAPRGQEQNGIEYHFMSPAAFEGHIYNNDFLEYEIVYKDVYYGTLNSELTRIWALSKLPVLDIDVKGALVVQKKLGVNCLSIFIQPPSIEILKERLEKRETETPEAIQIRLDKANYEMSFSNQFNAIVKNDSLEIACKEVAMLIEHFLATP